MNRTVRRKEKSGEIVAYSEISIRHNQTQLEYCRTSISALGGCTAGILGLTSYQGFVFFVLTVTVLWFLLLVRTGPSWNKFFRSRVPILTGSLTGGLFTYILFWTFIYGMVHVY